MSVDDGDLAAENARLRAKLRALQERFEALDASSSRRIQSLTDENEILAEANRLLMEREEASQRLGGAGGGNDGSDGEPVAVSRLLQVPDELLLPGPALRTTEVSALDGAHAFGNLLSVVAHPTRPELVLTGGVDKCVCLHDWRQRHKLGELQLTAPVLSLAFNPRPELSDYFVAGCMDGAHGLYKLVTDDSDGAWRIEQVRHFHDHTRHGTLRVAWSRCGTLFATGSSDKSLHLYKCSLLPSAAGSETSSAEPCEKIKSFFFNGTVEAIVFAPLPSAFEVGRQESSAATSGDPPGVKEVLVIAIRDDCYVHYVDCSTFEKERYVWGRYERYDWLVMCSSSLCYRAIRRVNMNTDGIEHVSYTIMDLRLSPTAKYLLAATDTNRLFIFAVRYQLLVPSGRCSRV
jgi:WD40 repeat protein